MLSYGCTRLEIGVQSIYEDVARDTNRSGCMLMHCIMTRGHTVKAVCESFHLAKDAGFKARVVGCVDAYVSRWSRT